MEVKNLARFSCPPGKFPIPATAPVGSIIIEYIIDVGFNWSIMNVPLSDTLSSYG